MVRAACCCAPWDCVAWRTRHHPNLGSRTDDRGARERLVAEPPLARRKARLRRQRRPSPARQRQDRAHARQARRRKTLETPERASLRQLARRKHRKPGGATGTRRSSGGLPFGLAGGGGRERLAADVSGPIALRRVLGSKRR